jgi:hypothetical protein
MDMTQSWFSTLNINPLPELLEFGGSALDYFTQRDLIGKDPGKLQTLWTLPEVEKILNKQNPEGSWSYPKRRKGAHPTENYDLLQTYRNLGILIEMYGMTRDHLALSAAAEYIFSCQADEGDIRGIFGSQYAPHYTAGLLELLIKAGYPSDSRVQKGFQWFENNRQQDGGWAWPLRTATVSYQEAIAMELPLRSDFSQPFAHALTLFVIRAYAAHPEKRTSSTADEVGVLIKERFFKADKYSDRRGADYWYKFQFPFWWGNLLTALDSLSQIGFSEEDPDVRQGLEWFRENQLQNGLWPTGYGKGTGVKRNQAWVGLAVCRMLKSFTR